MSKCRLCEPAIKLFDKKFLLTGWAPGETPLCWALCPSLRVFFKASPKVRYKSCCGYLGVRLVALLLGREEQIYF